VSVNPKRLLIGFGAFLSGFVINEPAPYELYMAGLIGLWFLFGLRISRTTGTLLALLLAFDCGGIISLTTTDPLGFKQLQYYAVSIFLSLSAVFFSAVIEEDSSRVDTVVQGYIAGAIVAAIIGIAAYFRLFPGSETFILYERARGTFQDPNVFGPFLILPACILLVRILTGKLFSAPLRMAGLLILSFAIFLSFSRAAWGLFAFSMVLIVFLMLLKQDSSAFRMKILGLSIAGLLVMVITIVIALQFDQVADLFTTRAKLVQSYDSAEFGRFARHRIGLFVAMENPLGIGPLTFGDIYGEDTHNIWLKALLDYGWLGFISFATTVALTLAIGFKFLLRDRPWQPLLMCAWVVFLGHILIATVIDIDHWRHFYLLIGLIWGCIGLEQRHSRILSG